MAESRCFLFFLLVIKIVTGSSPPLLPFRPPAVPLIVQSPFISFWSTSDTLSDSDTENWSGALAPISGLIRVDGVTYRWLGASPLASPVVQHGPATITATQTTVSFTAGAVDVIVCFNSPLIPTYPMLLYLPVTYISFQIAVNDGLNHTIELYFDADSKLFTNQSSSSTLVTWNRVDTVDNSLVLRSGAASQWPLNPVVCGQSVPLTASQIITWGYAYLIVENRNNVQGFLGPTEISRSTFTANGTLPPDDATPPMLVSDGFPGLAVSWQFAIQPGESVTRNITFFFDDILAASYYAEDPAWMGNNASGVFTPLWRKDLPFNDTVNAPTDVLSAAHSYASIAAAASDAWDHTIFTQLNNSGSVELATFGSLVFRQIMAAFVPIWHAPRNELWYVFKEMGSGGDFSTVDVLYPASPMFLANCPSLLRAALLPVLVLSANETIYKKQYIMHDLGKFPIADRGWGEQEDMPLEETGNVMHILAAIAMLEGGNITWLKPFFADGSMARWRDFLYSQIPLVPRQGTTDDFLGVVSNSTNLGVKGAVGLAAYGILTFMMGNETDAEDAWQHASYSSSINSQNGFFVDQVAVDGVNKSHFCWGWNACQSNNGSNLPPQSTFLMYNFLYARIMRMNNLFPNQQEMLARQADYYNMTIQGEYGIALMNGSTGVMPEWNSFFAASLYPLPNSSVPEPLPPDHSLNIFQSFIKAANSTSYRAPMTDYWDLKTAFYGGKYRARPVVGGIWAPVVVQLFDKLPVLPHEAPMAAAFERGHAKAKR